MNAGTHYVIELTPPGRAAVAVVLVHGPAAARLVDRCFASASGRPLQSAPIGKIVFGRWGAPSGEEVIACRRSEAEVEVHCHGGAAAVRGIVVRLVELGCRLAGWQEWVRVHQPDPIRAAARLALADAPTPRAAAILLDQYNGALRAAVEAALAAAAAEHFSQAADILDGLLAWRGVGAHLTSPWRVVIAGPPNVGKSSLLNALAGYQRAIVAPLPGTTRDVVTLTTAIDGWPVQLADTAGLREPGDELEAAGVELAESAIAHADLLIAVRDAQAAETGETGEIEIDPPGDGAACSAGRVNVLNKIDLLTGPRRDSLSTSLARGHRDCILTSASTGEGIATLVVAIGRALVPSPPPAGMAVPFTPDQLAAIERAHAASSSADAASVRAALQSLLAR
jgi:tRNA modification GTPase